MKRLILLPILLLLVTARAAFAQLPTNFIVQGAVWPSSIGPTTWATGTPFTQGFPVADSDAITGSLYGSPTNLKICTTSDCSSGRVASQFRILALWPSGNVKWVLVDGQTQGAITSSNLGTNSATTTGDTSMYLVKSSSGGNFGGFGSNMAAQTDSTHITITTGAATFIIQYGASGFNLFHDVQMGSTHLVLTSSHDVNDGLVIKGPPSGSVPNSSTCNGGSTGAQPGGNKYGVVSSTGLSRVSNVVTVTTTTAQGIVAGETVTVVNSINTSFSGTFVVASVISPTQFTYSQTAADANSGNNATTVTEAFRAGLESGCSTTYLANLDTNSTCAIFGNGPLRVELKCTGSFASASTACLDNGTGSTANCYLHWTVRYHFYYNKSTPKLQVELRNADYCTLSSGLCSGITDSKSAYKQFASFVAQVKMNFAAGTRNLTLAKDTTTPVTTTVTGASADTAYTYQAFSNQYEWFEWPAGNNCLSQNGNCVMSPIHRSASKVYDQNGYQIVKNGTDLMSGATSGTIFNKYPRGWADETDASNNGVEIGVYQFSAYWPKSLEFRSGGDLVQIGIWPSQSEYLSGGDQAYAIKWPGYQIHDLWFNFHTSALTATQLDDAFVGFQQMLVAHATRDYYNAAKDASNGLLALTYPIVDPIGEDTYLAAGAGTGGLGLVNWCHGSVPIFGTCLLDVSNSLAAGDAAHMHIFRFWGPASGGGGNQHDFMLGYLNNFLGRGCALVSGLCTAGLGTTGSQPGHYIRALHYGRFEAETALPRSDWIGGWRCSVGANCPDISAPPCDTFNHCATNETNWGYPVIDASNGGAVINGGMDDYLDSANSQDHAHFYGLINMYLVSGDESLKEQIMQGLKDAYMNQMMAFANPLSTAGGSQGTPRLSVSRAVGHMLMGAARMSIFLRSINDAEKDTIGTPTALFLADNVVAYNIAPDFPIPGLGAGLSGEALPTGCTAPYINPVCTSGINRSTGRDDSVVGENDHWGAYPSSGGSATPEARAKQSFHSAFLFNGLYEYMLAARDLRGANWYKSYSATCPTPLGTSVSTGSFVGGLFDPTCKVHGNNELLGDQIVLDMFYGLSKEQLIDQFLDTNNNNSGWEIHTVFDHLNSTDLSDNCQNTAVPTTTRSCTSCSHPGDCSRLICTGSSCGFLATQATAQSDTWIPWFGLWALTNAPQDLDGNSQQRTFENYMKRQDRGGGFADDAGAYHIEAVIDTVLKHNPTTPTSYVNDASLPVLKTLALTCGSPTGTATCPTSTTAAGGASGGTVTLSWTPPAGLSPVGGTSYRMRYSTSKSVVPWNIWLSYCLVGMTTPDCTTMQPGGVNPVTVNAADSSGGWALDPTANISWSWATQVPDNGSNSAVPSGSSYTFTAAAGTTYHFLLAAYQSLTAPPQTRFNTTVQR